MESNANVEVKIAGNGWVIQIKECLKVLQEEMEEVEDELRASVFNVPKEVLALKPEAYTPQSISIGPYHHRRSEALYDMDRYKLAAARRFQKRIVGRKFESVVVEEFKKSDRQIRCCYHKIIDYNEDTLALVMALDAVFLLEILQFYVSHGDQSSNNDVKQLGGVLHPAGIIAPHNSVLRDLMMLENQLPLFLLQNLLELQLGSRDKAAEKLCTLLRLVCEALSPFYFKLPELKINERAHVLEVLYYAIVPCVSNNPSLNPNNGEVNDTSDTADMSTVKQASCSLLWKTLSAIKVPVRFATKLPLILLSTLGNVPVLRDVLLNNDATVDQDAIEESPVKLIPLSRDELNIPSVADLYFAGVKFSPSHGDLTAIQFDETTATLYIPKIKLDIHTEVILRNLVAFEASAAAGALVLRRYIDFMNGMIDCEKDFRFMREHGIISNHLKSDGEVANRWNSMGNCLRPSSKLHIWTK